MDQARISILTQVRNQISTLLIHLIEFFSRGCHEFFQEGAGYFFFLKGENATYVFFGRL